MISYIKYLWFLLISRVSLIFLGSISKARQHKRDYLLYTRAVARAKEQQIWIDAARAAKTRSNKKQIQSIKRGLEVLKLAGHDFSYKPCLRIQKQQRKHF